MTNKMINPDTLFKSQQFGFSQIVTSTGNKTIYMSGQVGWDADRQLIGEGDLKAQTWQAFKNIEQGLKSVGASLADIVILRIYIVSSQLENSQLIKDALYHFFANDRLPASTWIGVQTLASEEFLIEIEPIAVVSEN